MEWLLLVMDPTTRGLVEAAREGDASAWAELVARTQDLAVAVAVGRVPDWDDARDAAQEALALAFVHLSELRDPSAFPGWLAALVRTACSRRTRRRRSLVGAGLDGVEVPDPGQPDPGSLVAGRDERQRVRAAVEALPEPLRSVIALHYLAQLSYPEIGEFLGIGTSAAKKRAWTARRHLKELLPMAAGALRDARPSQDRHFSDTILLFAAIRRSDLPTVRRLIASDPQLVETREDWTVAEALDAGLAYAGRATPLIRAAQTGDLAVVRTLVEAGAAINSPCSCAGAETALWAATAAAAPEVVAYLLDAGAHPDAAAFAGATPLHVASQRHDDRLARLLLAHGADPNVVDDHGRTPADWAARSRHRPPRGAADRMVPTGVRAVDLFAPMRPGGLQYWPPAYGLGQFVLLLEIARALAPAPCWVVGFAHGPYDHDGVTQDCREADIDATVALTPAGGDATARRADFAAVLARLRQAPDPKLVICLQTPGHTHDVTAALPELADQPGILTTVVVAPFTGEYPPAGSRPPEGYDGQVSFDTERARRGLWPAVDPVATTSTGYPSRRHRELAHACRRLLRRYRNWDPTLGLPAPGTLPEPASAGAAQELLRYLAQPFYVAESVTSQPGEDTPVSSLLEAVEGIVTPVGSVIQPS